MFEFGLCLAFVWGVSLACCIHYTNAGRFVANRMRFVFSFGAVGGDLMIMLLMIESDGNMGLYQVALILGATGIPIAAQGIAELYTYMQEMAGYVYENEGGE